MRNNEMLRRRVRWLLTASVSGVGGAGMVLLGPVGATVLGGLLLLALLGLTSAVVFSPRDEPIQRLLDLIKALWR
jgi:hypothetical protein